MWAFVRYLASWRSARSACLSRTSVSLTRPAQVISARRRQVAHDAPNIDRLVAFLGGPRGYSDLDI